jgi:hypothetical protein
VEQTDRKRFDHTTGASARRRTITGPVTMMLAGGALSLGEVVWLYAWQQDRVLAPEWLMIGRIIGLSTVWVMLFFAGRSWLTEVRQQRTNAEHLADSAANVEILRQWHADRSVKLDEILDGQSAITLRFLAVIDEKFREVHVRLDEQGELLEELRKDRVAEEFVASVHGGPNGSVRPIRPRS